MLRFYKALKCLFHEMMTPSNRDETSYQWMVIAISHAALGACFSTLIPINPIATSVGVSLGYFLVKEAFDISHGGSVHDSFVDAAFLGVGALYFGPSWWPWMVCSLALIGAVMRKVRRGL